MGVNNENAVETLKKQLLELTNHNEQILKAIEYAEEKHKEQKRKSGEPYIVHPLSVAITLAKLKMDIPTITAGILHDTLEDTDATEEEINQLFGSEVLYLVQGVTKLEKHKFKSKDQAQAENFRKLILSTAKDLRVLIIKLADRLDNIKSLDVFRREKQVRIALETLKIYAPLAHMLGLWEIKSQLEDYSFKYLYPSEYEKVKNFVGKARKEMEEYLKKNIVKPLEEELKKAGINATIKYRFKHLYSIWEKTKRKNIPLEEVHDILGIRIITDTKLECYTALGIVHSLWTPIIGKFKDYISNPKENLYQSLHTTVLGPEGKLVEIQIRTWTMHEIAERGIAAHWAYKKGKKPNPEDLQIANALRELIDVIQHAPTKYKELYQLLPEIMGKKIYVLTPKGDVIALPEGSTPIDFAYAIHTEIGNHCAGAKVMAGWFLSPISSKAGK
jgi:GTP pyrophosphokinase/guanosine-3',5'-bis(diphosphate) 3'-pyrophosphohydrolase